MEKDKEKIIKSIGDALVEAEQHLDYCGYGDSWEKSCAFESGLNERIDAAVLLYKDYCKLIDKER